MNKHIVKKGESLGYIAQQYGTSVREVWNHPSNAALRARRQTPHILFPGDEVTIPDAAGLSFGGSSGARSAYQLPPRVEHLIRLVLRDALGQPMQQMAYRLTLPDGTEVGGWTDEQGRVEVVVPLGVMKATLSFLDVTYDLAIGDLNPVSKVEGVQQRLTNLGYYHGAVDGIAGPQTQHALVAFQEAMSLQATGVLDDPTRTLLEACHEGVVRTMEVEDDIALETCSGLLEAVCTTSTVEGMDASELENLEEV